jgi:hypothetical protein
MIPGITMPMAGMTESAIEAILSASSTGLDVSTLFTGPDWASSTKKRVIVPVGVTRGSLVRTTPVLRSGTGRGGLLEIIVNGTLEGCGAPATTTLVAGLDGGDCILAEQSGVVVLGSGLIRAGGGAGGKGGAGTTIDGPYMNAPVLGGTQWGTNASVNGGQYNLYWGGSLIIYRNPNEHGGGTYVNVTSVTTGGFTYLRGSYHSNLSGWNIYYVSRYTAGTDPNTVGGNGGRGHGHDGANANGVAGGTNAGAGGNGGDWGASGTAGAAGNAGGGTAAGLGGYALKNTSNITNLFTGTLQGRTG